MDRYNGVIIRYEAGGWWEGEGVRGIMGRFTIRYGESVKFDGSVLFLSFFILNLIYSFSFYFYYLRDTSETMIAYVFREI